MEVFIVVDRFGVFCNKAGYLTRRLKCFRVEMTSDLHGILKSGWGQRNSMDVAEAGKS